MKPTRVARLISSLTFLDEMADNIQLFQAYTKMMSKFIIIEARVNHISQTLEQVIHDPFGFALDHVHEGDLLPLMTIEISKHVKGLLSPDDNPYALIMRVKS